MTVKKSAELKFKGRPAKIVKSETSSKFWLLKVKNANGKWINENISTSKRHLQGICKYN